MDLRSVPPGPLMTLCLICKQKHRLRLFAVDALIISQMYLNEQRGFSPTSACPALPLP